MRIGSIVTFVAAVSISLFAATHRWGDSGHAIGLLSGNGGKTRHPSVLKSGWKHYTQITTVSVLPPYRGDVRVALEGNPPLDYEIRFSEPVIDLGIRRHPAFRDGILHGLQPRDRLALWVLVRSAETDPVCGMAVSEDDPAFSYKGKTLRFCQEACMAAFKADPLRFPTRKHPRGKYHLAFNDIRTGRSLLDVPLIFKDKEAPHESGGHQ